MQLFLNGLIRYKYLLVIVGLTIVHILNMFIDVMEIDAAQYASISAEMFRNKSFLEVYHRGMDYLDKPPIPLLDELYEFSHFWN